MSDQLLLVSVGNTRTRFAMVRNGQLEPSRVECNADLAALCRAVTSHRGGAEADAVGDAPGGTPVLLASVNNAVCERLQGAIESAGRHWSRLVAATGERASGPHDLPIPIAHTLDASGAATVGADRLLDALGAYSRAKSACIVIDAGTAITVDFVDGEGTFHGGAIGPGVEMMFRSLHEGTAALPLVTAGASPPLPTFGKDTAGAITLGVRSAARGMAHLLIDRYAEFYRAYPRVIATGGDAVWLFENDELVEHIVPDLPLVGMWEAFQRLESLDDEAGDRTPDASA